MREIYYVTRTHTGSGSSLDGVLASFSVSQHCFLRPHAHSALKRCGNFLTTTMASLCYGRISWMLMNDNKSTPERKEIHGISIEGKSQSLKSFERSCDRAIEQFYRLWSFSLFLLFFLVARDVAVNFEEDLLYLRRTPEDASGGGDKSFTMENDDA